MDAQEVVEPVVDIIVGDEIRAANTIGDFFSGKDVSTDDAIHAAYTVGSDLLMLVPGIGAGAAAIKYGSKAGKVAKAAAATKKSVDLGRKATGAAIRATGSTNPVKKAAAAYSKKRSDRATKAASKAVNRVKKDKALTVRRETEKRSAYDAYNADAAKWTAKQSAAKNKRNSPKRKKMRKAGRFGSTLGNVESAINYFSEEE